MKLSYLHKDSGLYMVWQSNQLDAPSVLAPMERFRQGKTVLWQEFEVQMPVGSTPLGASPVAEGIVLPREKLALLQCAPCVSKTTISPFGWFFFLKFLFGF